MLVAAFEEDVAGMLEEERGRPIRWLFAADQVNGKKELTLGDTMMMKVVKLGQASHRALREWMH